MTEPVFGLYYSFKMMDGTATAPTQFTGEGMFVGRHGPYTIFATVIPKREANNNLIQSVQLTYTEFAYYSIPSPSDKVMLRTETIQQLRTYMRSSRFQHPKPNGRTSPILVLSADLLLS